MKILLKTPGTSRKLNLWLGIVLLLWYKDCVHFFINSFFCSAYKKAKQCFNREQKDYCSFGAVIEEINEKDVRNPFCKDGKDPADTGPYEKDGAQDLRAIIQPFVLCLGAWLLLWLISGVSWSTATFMLILFTVIPDCQIYLSTEL